MCSAVFLSAGPLVRARSAGAWWAAVHPALGCGLLSIATFSVGTFSGGGAPSHKRCQNCSAEIISAAGSCLDGGAGCSSKRASETAVARTARAHCYGAQPAAPCSLPATSCRTLKPQ